MQMTLQILGTAPVFTNAWYNGSIYRSHNELVYDQQAALQIAIQIKPNI